ncbi:hypothetical protein KSX_50250 [Ktedonospora formicarum]|uniref:Uncharacterized protein n=1 Tax=Ktedonospora formicarum TaxID=2778364 RepID=A0A8J3HZ24_9CHLR|nr:hypothetical protein KSX_50250 [Ktedonospora formicarum]
MQFVNILLIGKPEHILLDTNPNTARVAVSADMLRGFDKECMLAALSGVGVRIRPK